MPSPRDTENSQTICFKLIDEVAALQLSIYYVTYPEYSTIGQFMKLENLGSESIIIHKLFSGMMDLPNGEYDLITLQGYYGMEQKPVRQKVNQGITQISSIRISSGHGQTPALILGDRQVNDAY